MPAIYYEAHGFGIRETCEYVSVEEAVAFGRTMLADGACKVVLSSLGIGREQLFSKIRVRREPLNRGGYTRTGVYFGTGQPLFFVDGPDVHIRARNRDHAIAQVRERWPNSPVKGPGTKVDNTNGSK